MIFEEINEKTTWSVIQGRYRGCVSFHSHTGFSCAGHCGSEDACLCDSDCIDAGDCCEDFVTECKDLYVL